MDIAAEARTTPVLSVGVELTGGWRVVRVLEEVAGIDAVLVEDDAFGHAFCFPIAPDAPDPVLDEGRAIGWGSVRRILRDEHYGRIVLDEVPEGTLLADRLADGWMPPSAWHAGLAALVREQHRKGNWHGQIVPDRIVISADALAVAGWGLGPGETEDLKARDLAALSAIAGLGSAPVRATADLESPSQADEFEVEDVAGGSGPASPRSAPSDSDSSKLRAALVSDHLPTIRTAIGAWVSDQQALETPEFLRAKDALARLERKVAEQLETAREMLRCGDPLGAVALCREAVRLGAEEEAGPVLRQARKQARALLSRPRLPAPKKLLLGVATVAVLALLGFAGWLSVRPDHSALQVDEKVTGLLREGGERAVVNWLLLQKEREEAGSRVSFLLHEHMRQLVESEREMLLALRGEVVARGARPLRADQLTEESLTELETLAATSLSSGILPARVSRALVLLDKAAALYRAGTELRAEDAVVGFDHLLREDPVFDGPHSPSTGAEESGS